MCILHKQGLSQSLMNPASHWGGKEQWVFWKLLGSQDHFSLTVTFQWPSGWWILVQWFALFRGNEVQSGMGSGVIQEDSEVAQQSTFLSSDPYWDQRSTVALPKIFYQKGLKQMLFWGSRRVEDIFGIDEHADWNMRYSTDIPGCF